MTAPVDLDRDRPAVFIKFDRNPLHHGTLGAIRSLGRAGVPVYLVQESRRMPVSWSRYATRSLRWPADLSGPEQAVEVLQGLAGEVRGRPVLYAVDDAGAVFLAEYGERLGPVFDIARQPPEVTRSLVDKESLAHACAEAGVPHPDTVRPSTWADLVDGPPPGGLFPVLLKRIAPWVPPAVPGLPSVSLIRDRAELRDLRRAALSPDPGLLLQQFIPYGPRHDWFFNGYYDAGSTCRFAGTAVKLRSWPPYSGATTYGRIAAQPVIHAQVDALLRRLRYTGIVDVDLRYDPRTTQYHVLDVNPRLGAQHRLFRGAGGLDVIRAAHLDLTGGTSIESQAAEGRTFVTENLDRAAARRYRRDGRGEPVGWWRALRTADEYAWFARDDPVPFAAMVARSLIEGARYRLRRGRRPGPARSLSEVVTRWSAAAH